MMRFPRTHQPELEVLLTSILDLCCSVDAFWQCFETQWLRELLLRTLLFRFLCVTLESWF
jgi:hypothetical protein